MTTTTPAIPAATTDGGGGGPIRRVIAGALVTGAATAALLTLVVSAGAREHVITGSALLGFAVGWAVLAVLSARMTDQPQRWAWVPAAGLAATAPVGRGGRKGRGGGRHRGLLVDVLGGLAGWC